MFDFSKPVCVAAGPWGLPQDTSNIGIYFTKTVTLHAREGGEEPTIVPIAGHGYLNRVGLKNRGAAEFIKSLKHSHVPVFASIFADTVGDWAVLISSLCERVDGFELNLSCPNGPRVSFLRDEGAMYLSMLAKNLTDVPVVVKLPPLMDVAGVMATAALHGGADAVTISNTLKASVFDGDDFIEGGLSGSPLKPVSLRCVRHVSETVDIPIFGVGGVRCAEDVRDYLRAGASAVQVGSAHLENPNASAEIAAEYKERGQ